MKQTRKKDPAEAQKRLAAIQASYSAAYERVRIMQLELRARAEELVSAWLALSGFRVGDFVRFKPSRGIRDLANVTFRLHSFRVYGLETGKPRAVVYGQIVRRDGILVKGLVDLGGPDDIEHVS